eukprot:3074938-Prymnesium_polylepis.1
MHVPRDLLRVLEDVRKPVQEKIARFLLVVAEDKNAIENDMKLQNAFILEGYSKVGGLNHPRGSDKYF